MAASKNPGEQPKNPDDVQDPSQKKPRRERELTRRMIVQAGWAVPIILATAGRSRPDVNPEVTAAATHGDRVSHGDGGHSDIGHQDATFPHNDVVVEGQHGDQPAEHDDTGHQDQAHNDQMLHSDLIAKTIKPK